MAISRVMATDPAEEYSHQIISGRGFVRESGFFYPVPSFSSEDSKLCDKTSATCPASQVHRSDISVIFFRFETS